MIGDREHPALNLETLFKVWRETGQEHDFRPPAQEVDLAAAEARLGFKLPEPFRQLYGFSNGLSLNAGNFTMHALIESDELGSLVSMSDQLREWEWPVPAEVLAFGANGSGEPYGLWIGPHDAERFPEPIVQIGEIFEPGCMGLWAPSLRALLLEETVCGLVLKNHQSVVAERFGLALDSLPDEAMVDAMVEYRDPTGPEFVEGARRFRLIENWAAPDLDPAYQDPYKARLDAAALAKLLA